jgi:hypothetical protein
MNKYFITFGAVALSFGAVYGAEANLGEAQESAAIGGASVPVDGGVLQVVEAKSPVDANDLELNSRSTLPTATASPAITAQKGTEDGKEPVDATTPALSATAIEAAADEDEGMGEPMDTAADATTAELTDPAKSAKSDQDTTVGEAATKLEKALAEVAVTVAPKTGEAAPASTPAGVSPIIPSQQMTEENHKPTQEPKPAVLDTEASSSKLEREEGMVREGTAAVDADPTASTQVIADID